MAFNKVILVGNLTADPELKKTPTGVSVVSFTLAVDRRFSKENTQQTDFISVVAWRQTAEFIVQHFMKGNSILVCGSLQVRSFADNTGGKRYVTEVVADEVSFSGYANRKAPAAEPSVFTAPYTDPPKSSASTVPEGKASPAQVMFPERDDGMPF